MPPAVMEHARAHTPHKFRSTRNSRIRYDLRSVIRKRAHEKQRQRAQAMAGTIVVGRFICHRDEVVFEAVAIDPCFVIDDRGPLTRNIKRMARWRTRQAARQWLLRHFNPCLQLVNLAQLRGREVQDMSAVDVTTLDTQPRA